MLIKMPMPQPSVDRGWPQNDNIFGVRFLPDKRHHQPTMNVALGNMSATTVTPEDELADSKTAVALWKYGSPILIITGTVCNILVLCVMLQKKQRGTVSGLYLSVLAIVDLMCLYTGLLRHWITHTFNVDIRQRKL